ncbi:DUF4913 domain-containing protein (plasmid) [Curtobacterium sp. TC1]|uniref:DUF4913 domain-containing protein n=1 Tax=Curtobacterium sp. TC1 TaxID=2862880 RepID=UPI001C9B7C02|nr:DUF4913 domain-containing protein [Curtobacterium sp. TC1]QZQ53612.1 DUF4913 domain-containing protein [Curtobacterium sp. TC1]
MADIEGFDPARMDDAAAELTDPELTDPELAGEDDEDVGQVSMRAVLLDWVTAHFAGVEYVHTDERAPCCPEWWKRPEVVSRL